MSDFEKANLVLIKDDPAAQKLIVTWPQVALLFDAIPGDDHLHPRDGKEEFAEQLAYAAWASATSGQVDRDDIPLIAEMLWRNNFIGPGGVVEPTVLDFIRATVAVSLGIRPQPKKKQT